LRILTYGWPLLLSFGVTAVGGSVDRLLLAHFDGAAAVGPYGVVADILRQSFSVFGEAIVLSLVTVAKQHANEGNVEASNRTMRKAFNSCLAAAAFGAAFFLVFGDMLLRLLLRPDFVGPSRDLIPFFTIAFAFMTMRNFYFAQVIYFIHASYLELIVSSLFLVVSIVLSLILIPIYGAHGAAVGLMMSSIVSCVAFMVIGRRWYSLPIDLTGLGSMASLAVIFVLGARWIASLVPSANLMLVIDIVVFVAFSAFAVLRFGLLSSASEIPEPVAVERRVTPTPVAERGS